MRGTVLHHHLPMPIAEMRPYRLLCLKLEFGESAEKLRIHLSDPQQQTVSKILVGNMVLGTSTSNVKTMKLYLSAKMDKVMDTQYLHCWYQSAKHCKKHETFSLWDFSDRDVYLCCRLSMSHYPCPCLLHMSWCFFKTVITLFPTNYLSRDPNKGDSTEIKRLAPSYLNKNNNNNHRNAANSIKEQSHQKMWKEPCDNLTSNIPQYVLREQKANAGLEWS